MKMIDLKLCESDFRVASIVWDNEPLGSGELVKLCKDKLGWKKSTTYTVLKKLCEKGVLKNEASVVTALVGREEVQKYESVQLMQKAFDGSIPQFIAAFMGDRKLSEKEVEDIKRLIDRYKEG
jgi:predicted transcriptional regulator